MTFPTFFSPTAAARLGRDGSRSAPLSAGVLGWLVLAGDTDTGKIERVTRDLLASETLRQEQVGRAWKPSTASDDRRSAGGRSGDHDRRAQARIADLMAPGRRRHARGRPERRRRRRRNWMRLKARHTQLAARVDDLVTRRRHHDGRLNARLEPGTAHQRSSRPRTVDRHPFGMAPRLRRAAIAGRDLLSRKYGADLIAFTPEYLAVATAAARFVRLMRLGRPRADRGRGGTPGCGPAAIMR